MHENTNQILYMIANSRLLFVIELVAADLGTGVNSEKMGRTEHGALALTFTLFDRANRGPLPCPSLASSRRATCVPSPPLTPAW
jgi:hypothetical protein